MSAISKLERAGCWRNIPITLKIRLLGEETAQTPDVRNQPSGSVCALH
jgi:hypothetical protein